MDDGWMDRLIVGYSYNSFSLQLKRINYICIVINLSLKYNTECKSILENFTYNVFK